MENLIPDRRAGSSKRKSAPPPTHPEIYGAAWLGEQQGKTIDPQPGPALGEEEDEPGLAEPRTHSRLGGRRASAPGITPGPTFDPSESAFANRSSSSETTPSVPHAPVFVSAPDTRAPFSTKKNPFAQRR
jgi:hypothetical protein